MAASQSRAVGNRRVGEVELGHGILGLGSEGHTPETAADRKCSELIILRELSALLI